VVKQDFSPGDKVRCVLATPIQGHDAEMAKFVRYYTGEVVTRLNDVTYIVQVDRGKRKIFHVDKLKPIA